ncbi:uncharacterized protein METZ01_LOCUS196563 [marine metagenome]|uniref:Uncharacterized protein n=1 Tax=marine metagenome TaxID=408172 RepID=A0A382DZW0_9ZZZZ
MEKYSIHDFYIVLRRFSFVEILLKD